jgi:hypothetical protein
VQKTREKKKKEEGITSARGDASRLPNFRLLKLNAIETAPSFLMADGSVKGQSSRGVRR